MSWTTRHCSMAVKSSHVSCKDTLLCLHCHFLFSFPVIFTKATFHYPSSVPQLSFVLRPRLHAALPEQRVWQRWCQSRSPSWRGTCIGWHRTPALLWPVPRPPSTLRTLYPNSGPPQLLGKGEITLSNVSSSEGFNHVWISTLKGYLHSPIHLLGSIISRNLVSSNSSNNISCFALSSFTCCCLLSSIFSLLLKYCSP